MRTHYWEFKKQVESTKTEMLVDHMMKAFELKNDLKNLSNSLNSVNMTNVLNTVTASDQSLNLHLNTLKDDMMLFKETVRSSQMHINTQTLMNFSALTVYISDEIIQRLKKYIKKRISSSKVKLFDKKKMLSSATVRLLLKIETFNCLIIAHELSDLKYDLILRQNWLRHHNSNINWRTSTMRIINVRHKMHTLLSFNLRWCVNSDESKNLNLISDDQMRWWVCKHSTQVILYVINDQNDENCDKKNTEHNDLRIQALLIKYKKVFWLKLSDELSSERDFVHDIDTDDAKSVNQNTYSLLQTHMKKQQKQIEYLLKHELIHSFFSSWNFSVIFVKKSENT